MGERENTSMMYAVAACTCMIDFEALCSCMEVHITIGIHGMISVQQLPSKLEF